jgi:hypothetical protein
MNGGFFIAADERRLTQIITKESYLIRVHPRSSAAILFAVFVHQPVPAAIESRYNSPRAGKEAG